MADVYNKNTFGYSIWVYRKAETRVCNCNTIAQKVKDDDMYIGHLSASNKLYFSYEDEILLNSVLTKSGRIANRRTVKLKNTKEHVSIFTYLFKNTIIVNISLQNWSLVEYYELFSWSKKVYVCSCLSYFFVKSWVNFHPFADKSIYIKDFIYYLSLTQCTTDFCGIGIFFYTV